MSVTAAKTLFVVSSLGRSIDVFLKAFRGNNEFAQLWTEWQTAGEALQTKLAAGTPLNRCREELSQMKVAEERLAHRFPKFAARWVPLSIRQRKMPGNCVRIEIDLPPSLAESAGGLAEHVESYFMAETKKRNRRGEMKRNSADIRALVECRGEKEAASRGQTHYISGLKNKGQDSRSSDVKLSQLRQRYRRILRDYEIPE